MRLLHTFEAKVGALVLAVCAMCIAGIVAIVLFAIHATMPPPACPPRAAAVECE